MILAVLQARMSSSRLPGKVLLPLAGAPMIVRQVERVRRAERIERLVVATSTDATDDPLAAAVGDAGVEVFRGPLDDVLGRFIAVLDACPADQVVRLTGDCPLADPQVIDAAIVHHLTSDADYTNNRDARAYPKGQDVEVITAAALRDAAARASTAEEHEHVTWGVRHSPDRYRLAHLAPAVDQGHVRWTVDLPADYAFVKAVYEALYPVDAAFTSKDVRALVRSRPDLQTLGGEPRL